MVILAALLEVLVSVEAKSFGLCKVTMGNAGQSAGMRQGEKKDPETLYEAETP